MMFLIAGYDEKPRLFETQPSGSLVEYYADAIGQKRYEVLGLLEKRWRHGMSFDDAVALALDALKIPLAEGDRLTPERVVLAYVDAGRKFRIMGPDDLAQYFG